MLYSRITYDTNKIRSVHTMYHYALFTYILGMEKQQCLLGVLLNCMSL
jgi:hypothetical protein